MSAAEGWATNGAVRLRWVRDPGPAGAQSLLLVNGLGSPLVAYEEGFVAELNQRGFDVVRFDNRDAGRSTSTDGGYLLADMAADAAAVMGEVGWGDAHVFGMSMGGMIVQQLGIDAPDRLRSITSLMSATGHPDFGRSSDAARQALLAAAPSDRAGWLDHRVATEEIWASPAQWDPGATRAKGELLFDYGVQIDGVERQYTAVVNSGPRDDLLVHVRTPTLVLHGSADTLIAPSGGRHTADVMPNATYIELDGMGHDLPGAWWPTLADHLLDFTTSLA